MTEKTPLVSISREYEISCAHHLPLHKGKCRTPHGHNYLIQVQVEGNLQTHGPATGMVMDFAVLDSICHPVLNAIDHKDLNEELPEDYQPPTAENIARWIFDCLLRNFLTNQSTLAHLEKVRVYETKNSYVEVLF